jgi:hypothetical protein
MQDTTDVATLAALFREAGSAHHRAFASVSGADAEWPVWYAEYLTPRLETLLSRRFPVRELADELAALDAAQRAHAPGTDWPTYYAAALVRKGRVSS